MKSLSEELKPCPFCGEKDIRLIDKIFPTCSECGATQNNVIGGVAIGLWNQRVTPEGYALVDKALIKNVVLHFDRQFKNTNYQYVSTKLIIALQEIEAAINGNCTARGEERWKKQS